MKTILAPIDFSPVSKPVIAEAAALAGAFHGRLVMLNVVQPLILEAEFATFYGKADEIMAATERIAANRLAEFERQVAGDGVPVESIQRVGSAVANIVQQANRLEADYIVMGSHGHTALYDLFVGSTTHGVLLRAKCPVVIVRPTPAHVEPDQRRNEHVTA